MKLYINAENQLPVFATSISTAATDEEGVLRVYEQGSSGTISSFIFKRDTTVPLDITVAGTDLSVDDVKNLTFGVKLKGKYDDALVVKAEAASGEKVEEGIHFTLSATFNSSVIDEALKANGDSSDDIESADFIAAVSWENSSGEVTESATVDVEIRNNVVREGDMIAGEGTPSGVQWTALAVVKLPYAEYLALCEAGEDREDVLYICSDAPSPTAEVESEIESVKESVSKVEENVSGLEDRVSDCETDCEAIEAKVDALAESTDLTGYARLDTEQTWTAEQTLDANLAIENGKYIRFATGSPSIHVGLHVEVGEDGLGYLYLDRYWAASIDTPTRSAAIATEEDLADVAKLDEENTWTASQSFKIGDASVKFSATGGSELRVGMDNADSSGRALFSISQSYSQGVNLTGTWQYNGNEIATIKDVENIDLSAYAKLAGADFTGAVTIDGVAVATIKDVENIDLSAYAKLAGADFTGTLSVSGVEVATQAWVKDYHDTDIEAVKAWVTEELSKLDAATQAAEIEELQEEIEALKDEIYAAMITVEIPEDDYEFRLSDFMEGSSASDDYTGGEVPVYDFTVEWGDGKIRESYSNENWSSCAHTYAAAGTYTIKIKGTFEYIGHSGYADSDASLETSNLITELWFPN